MNPQGRVFIEVPWILSGAISPTNRYFKAHLFYFDVETLAACASRHFEVVHTEARGNLRMLLKPREVPGALRLPPPGYAVDVHARLSRQGWFGYLIRGQGWRKPFTKLGRIVSEHRIRGFSGRRILASFQSRPAPGIPETAVRVGGDGCPLTG
jgi:hypothetical protein